MAEMVTMQEWAARFRDFYRSIRLGKGMSRRQIEAFAAAHHVVFPEDYVEFMSLTGGADILHGRIVIWALPDESGHLTGPGAAAPADAQSVLYMNRPEIKKKIPFCEGVFLIASNEMGDYLGITDEKPGYPLKFISPDMQDFWYYTDFASWLEEIWEEQILHG